MNVVLPDRLDLFVLSIVIYLIFDMIHSKVELIHAGEVKWSEGACSGTVYSGDEKLTKLMAKVRDVHFLTLLSYMMYAADSLVSFKSGLKEED